MMKKQDQEVGEDERMAVSGNMATVTTKYSHPTGRPYGFGVDPEFKVNQSVVPLSGVVALPCSGSDFTIWCSICTICPTIKLGLLGRWSVNSATDSADK